MSDKGIWLVGFFEDGCWAERVDGDRNIRSVNRSGGQGEGSGPMWLRDAPCRAIGKDPTDAIERGIANCAYRAAHRNPVEQEAERS